MYRSNVQMEEDDYLRERIREILNAQIKEQREGGVLLGDGISSRKALLQASRLMKRKKVAKGKGYNARMEVMNPWLIHVRNVRDMHPDLSYKEALQMARKSYKGGARVGGARVGGARVGGRKKALKKKKKVLGAAKRKNLKKQMGGYYLY